jgi:CarD family transcriptional regulator
LTQFSVGDKVIHPQYGLGKITAMQHLKLVKEPDHYYVIELLEPNSTLYVPVNKVEQLGIRPVMSQDKFKGVLRTLRSVPIRLSKDYKKRQEKIEKKIASSRPIQLAEAIRDLTGRGKSSHLTKKDQDLLNRGRELLATEMAAATDIEVVEAHEQIDNALKVALTQEAEETEADDVQATA